MLHQVSWNWDQQFSGYPAKTSLLEVIKVCGWWLMTDLPVQFWRAWWETSETGSDRVDFYLLQRRGPVLCLVQHVVGPVETQHDRLERRKRLLRSGNDQDTGLNIQHRLRKSTWINFLINRSFLCEQKNQTFPVPGFVLCDRKFIILGFYQIKEAVWRHHTGL